MPVYKLEAQPPFEICDPYPDGLPRGSKGARRAAKAPDARDRRENPIVVPVRAIGDTRHVLNTPRQEFDPYSNTTPTFTLVESQRLDAVSVTPAAALPAEK